LSRQEIYSFEARDGVEIEGILLYPLDFEEGQRCYFAREFAEAVRCFQRVLAMNPEDAPATLYLERAEKFLREGVPKDWDGVRKMDKK
jgi:hypothetical protein